MGTGYTRNDSSNNIADGNIINASDLDGEFDAIESAMGTSGHTHDGTSAEGGPVTVVGPVQDLVVSATEVKPKTTNTLDIGTNSLLFKDMFIDGVATLGSIKIDNDGTIGSATTVDAIAISSGGIVTFKDDIIIKDGGTIGVTSAVDAMTVSSAGIVTFKDDIIIKDGGTIGSASDADAIAISSGGVVTFSQAVSNLGNVTGKTSSGFVLALQTSDTTVEATNVLGKIEFSAPDEASGTDAILVGASIEALAEDTFDSSTNSTALVFKTNTTGAATERMRLTSAGDLHFLDNRKAIFGAGSDLQIYHDGSNSYITDAGSGSLYLRGSNQVRIESATGEKYFIANANADTNLYYNNAVKLATTSTGIDVTGAATFSGNVGIGTSSPNLHGWTNAVTLNTSSSAGYEIGQSGTKYGAFALQGDGRVQLTNFTANPLTFQTNNTEAMRIDSSGNVGIGDATPSQKLDVSGNIRVTGGFVEFSGDTSTPSAAAAIHRPADNTLAFSTLNAERMRIDNSGNVGIGCTPDQPLQVKGIIETQATNSTNGWALYTHTDNTFRINYNSAGSDEVTIDSSGNLGVGGTVTGTGTSVFASLDISGDIDVDGTTNLDVVDIDGAVDFASTTAHAGNATFADNAKAIFGAGSDLQIYHDGSNSTIRDGGTGVLILQSNQMNVQSSTGEQSAQFNENSDVKLYFDNSQKFVTTSTGIDVTGGATFSGNVGIGVTPSGHRLQVSGGTSYFLDTVYIAGGLGKMVSSDSASNPLIFGRNASEDMRIDSSGNVGIGTSLPSATMHLKAPSGNTGLYIQDANGSPNLSFLDSAGTVQWQIYSTMGGAAGLDPLVFYSSGGEKMRIHPSAASIISIGKTGSGTSGQGMVLIGNPASPQQYFNKSYDGSVNGVLFYHNDSYVGGINYNNTSTVYATSSDYRLKTDVQPMTGASARVQALNPVNFEWISEGTRVDGFLAHEAQAVVPEAVVGAKDAMRDEEYEVTPAVLDDDGKEVTPAVMGTRSVPDYQGIDQSKLVPLLTAALQEAIAKIETLETKVAALEGA